MLTRQGWMAVAGAVGLVALGRVLGLVELYALGGAVGALVVGCTLLVGSRRLDLAVRRSVHPSRVQVGSSSRVELQVRNLGRGPTPVLTLADPVSGTRGAELTLAPLTVGEQVTAAYRLPTSRRGLLELGPLSVTLEDPFGLSRTTTPAAPPTEVIVYPHVDVVAPLPHTSDHDLLSGMRRRNTLGRTGEELYALRPYVMGDDLRRVHWPSTARHDELMVRQHELPWQGRATVVLDVRAHGHAGNSFEVAVSAAAGVLSAAARRSDMVRVLTTAGVDSDFGAGAEHLEALMEHLAVVGTTPDANLRRTVEHLRRSSTGGALVLVGGDLPPAEVQLLGSLRPRFGSLTVICVAADAEIPPVANPSASVGSPARPRAHFDDEVVRIDRARPFVRAWEDHLARLRRSNRSTPVGAL